MAVCIVCSNKGVKCGLPWKGFPALKTCDYFRP